MVARYQVKSMGRVLFVIVHGVWRIKSANSYRTIYNKPCYIQSAGKTHYLSLVVFISKKSHLRRIAKSS